MTLLDARARRTAALNTRLASLKHEVSWWGQMLEPAGQRDGSAAAGADELKSLQQIFRPHTSQIKLVCGVLEAMHACIAAELKVATEKGPLSSEVIVGFERNILAAIQIWDF